MARLKTKSSNSVGARGAMTMAAAAVGLELKRSRPPFARMRKLRELILADKYPNCQSMARVLEVSSKTIQRDLEFARDQLDWPVEYDEARFGYHFTGPVEPFPAMTISEGEVVAVLVAQQALELYKGTPFEKPLRSACRKLMEALPETITVEAGALELAVSFRAVGGSVPDLEVFATVSRGVLEQRELTFHYHKLGSAQVELRRARPYHLGWVENQWYCFAHDLDRGAMRTFSLPRMAAVRVSKVKFVRPADFSIERHLAESFGVFRGSNGEGKVLRVRLRFDAWAGRLIGERVWHGSQVVKRLKEGGVELRLELGCLEEVERWVLSWGAHVEVLAPARLRARVLEAARAVVGRG